jgi:hypothetical protein
MRPASALLLTLCAACGQDGGANDLGLPVDMSAGADLAKPEDMATGRDLTQPAGDLSQSGGDLSQPGGDLSQSAGDLSQSAGDLSQPARDLAMIRDGSAAPDLLRADASPPDLASSPDLSVDGGAIQPIGPGGMWTLIFDDEFNGNALDLSKWRPNWLAGSDTAITPPVNGGEAGCYDPAQVTVSGGALNLTAVARNCVANNGASYSYASGMVQSHPHFNFTYGFMEARIWLDGTATAAYNWPAWWADGSPLNWPTTGEIDIMEGLSGKLCWHYHYSGGGPGHCPTVATPSGWHTFGVNWQAGRLDFYYDGALDSVSQTTGVVNNQMFLILNYAISNTYTKTTPSTMKVDYVRVWQ